MEVAGGCGAVPAAVAARVGSVGHRVADGRISVGVRAGDRTLRGGGTSGCDDLEVPVAMHCPRCKHPLAADDPDGLADDMLAHLREVHAHEPPREHVLARIAQQNRGDGNR